MVKVKEQQGMSLASNQRSVLLLLEGRGHGGWAARITC